MLRTHKTRPVGGGLVLALTLFSVCVGGLGTAAQADGAGPASPAGPSAPAGQVTDSQVAKAFASVTGSGQALTTPLPGQPPTVQNEGLVLKRGLTDSLDVAANDVCGANPNDTCTYAVGAIPAGWGASLTPDGHTMTIWVPRKTRPGAYSVGYTVTSNAPGPVQQTAGQVVVAVTPDNYNPPAGMLFTHPYRPRYRNLIRTHVLRTINSVPTGGRIRVASWSFASWEYRSALKAAAARGVVVQIVLSGRNTKHNSDYRLLARRFGTSITPDGNWVHRCSGSCRGTTGTMHSKIFLFSQAYRTPDVEMTGSANLTDFAVSNQWNQMNTVVANPPVYDEAVHIFNQMAADRPAPYVETHFPDLWSYYYPRGAATPANDFMLQALGPVHCTGATNTGRSGRTIIKIAMYAWYAPRGAWLAKRVRQLWNQGCQIQIVFGLLSNQSKAILYSPAGRGRIPMRQILLTNKAHVPIYYLHDKWVAITGNYGSNTANSLSFQGSFNFDDMGFTSDEQFQMIRGRSVYNKFARDFTLLWTDRQARAPSPVSQITAVEGRYGSQDGITLGTGIYRYMPAD